MAIPPDDYRKAVKQHAEDMERQMISGAPVGNSPLRQLSKPMPRPLDYDDFKRDVASPDNVDIWPDASNDWYNVRYHGNGQVYRFTLNQVITEGFGGKRPCPPPSEWVEDELTPAPSAHVHILYQGSPVCGFSHSRPVDWPRGHEWVSLDAFRQGAKISCHGCFEGARKL